MSSQSLSLLLLYESAAEARLSQSIREITTEILSAEQLAGLSLHEQANALIRHANGSWILLLTNEETFQIDDCKRLSSLLRHPMRPAYEFPLVAGPVKPSELRFLPQNAPYALKLFPREAGIRFNGSLAAPVIPGETSLWSKPFRCFIPVQRLGLKTHPYLGYNRDLFSIETEVAKVRKNPNDSRALESLGMTLLNQNRIQEGYRALKRAQELTPESITILNALGYAAMELGQNEEAIRIYEYLLSLSPNFHLAYVNIAVMLLRQNQIEKAEALLLRALKLQPDDPKAYYNLSVCYVVRGELDRAIEACRTAVSFDKTYITALSDLGGLLLQAGRLEEAEHCLHDTLKQNPSDFGSLYNLGMLYKQQNKKEKALRAWGALLKRFPEHETVKRLIGTYPEVRAFAV